MHTNTEYKQIALTDFRDHYEIDPNDALDRMGVILEEDELFMLRMKMLTAIAEAAQHEGYTREPKDLDHAIREVGKLGILAAYEEDNGVDFEQLASIFGDAEALTKTRELFLSYDAVEPSSPKLSALTDLLPLLLDATPNERGTRYLPSQNAYLFECELTGVAGGSAVEDSARFHHCPPHLNSDEVFFAEIPEERIPNGLCRLSLFLDPYCETEPIAASLIELELENGEWLIEVAIRDVVEDEVPEVKKLFVCLTFADEHNVSEFITDSVRQFVNRLTEGDQKSRASDYLAGGTQ